MDQNQIGAVQKKIGYSFSNVELLKQAFIRRSFSKENQLKTDNELLEFLGDSVVGSISAEVMIDAFATIIKFENRLYSPLDEGKLTIKRSTIVSEEYLAGRIRALGLHTYLLVSKGDEKLGLIYKDSVQADLFESIIGAIAIDSNYNYAKIRETLITMSDLENVIAKWFKEEKTDRIAELKILCAGNKITNPVYSKSKSKGEYRATCTITLPNKLSGGTIKKTSRECKLISTAYNVAAEMALVELNEVLRKANIVSPTTNIKSFKIVIDKKNPVSQLQELAQKGVLGSMPKYTYKRLKNSNWNCECKVSKYAVIGKGTDVTKKDARKAAAINFLSQIVASPISADAKKTKIENKTNNNSELAKILSIVGEYYKDRGVKSNVSHLVSVIKDSYPDFKAKKYGFKNTNEFLESNGYVVHGYLFRKR
jgi:ribonuclease-3